MAKKSSFWKDFKDFITRGNVLDMAVGVVIGGAFGKITSGLVSYIINPVISLLTGGISLTEWRTPLGDPLVDEAGEFVVDELGKFTYANYIEWGLWIQTIIDFLIIALAIFSVLRVIMKAKKVMDADKILEEERKAKEAAEKAEADKKIADEKAAELAAKQAALDESILKQAELLEEIRDIMKKK